MQPSAAPCEGTGINPPAGHSTRCYCHASSPRGLGIPRGPPKQAGTPPRCGAHTRAAAAADTEPPPGAADLPPTARTKAPSGLATNPPSTSPACTRYLRHSGSVGQSPPSAGTPTTTTTQSLLTRHCPLQQVFIHPLALQVFEKGASPKNPAGGSGRGHRAPWGQMDSWGAPCPGGVGGCSALDRVGSCKQRLVGQKHACSHVPGGG